MDSANRKVEPLGPADRPTFDIQANAPSDPRAHVPEPLHLLSYPARDSVSLFRCLSTGLFQRIRFQSLAGRPVFHRDLCWHDCCDPDRSLVAEELRPSRAKAHTGCGRERRVRAGMASPSRYVAMRLFVEHRCHRFLAVPNACLL